MENSKKYAVKLKAGRMVQKTKTECHKLMDLIFGATQKGRRQAYIFFKREFGRDIHFSEMTNYGEIFKVRKVLYDYAIERGIIDVTDIGHIFDTLN